MMFCIFKSASGLGDVAINPFTVTSIREHWIKNSVVIHFSRGVPEIVYGTLKEVTEMLNGFVQDAH